MRRAAGMLMHLRPRVLMHRAIGMRMHRRPAMRRRGKPMRFRQTVREAIAPRKSERCRRSQTW